MLRKKTCELIEEINNYDFFSKVGAPLEGDFKKAKSLKQAARGALEHEWQDLSNAFWNQLEVFQRKAGISVDRDWNGEQSTEAVKLIEPAKLNVNRFFT